MNKKIRNEKSETAGSKRKKNGSREKIITGRSKCWKGSTTVESAIIVPICFVVVIIIIQIGIMILDKHSFSMVTQDWARKQITAGKADWQSGLQTVVDRNLIYPAKIKILKVTDTHAEMTMEYRGLLLPNSMVTKLFTVRITLPHNHKNKLYHFLNAKQLISRIPFLDQIQEKYFEMLRKIKKD